MIFGSIAEKGTAWYDFWYIIEQGAWTVFNQLPLLFVIGLPIGLAKKENARAVMEAFLIYLIFNYFVCGMLTLWGPTFGVDFAQDPVPGSGLTTIANIKTLDTSMVGAILIASLAVGYITSYSMLMYRNGSVCSKVLPSLLSQVSLSCCLLLSSSALSGRISRLPLLRCRAF